MELVALLLVIGSAGAGYRWVWKRKRSGPRPSRCDVNSIAPGWVELRGVVRGRGSVRSPVSGASAVGYSISVEAERGVVAWDRVVEECRVSDFQLEDETGTVLVAASACEVELETNEQRGKGGPFRTVPRRIVELLHRHGRSVSGVLFARAFRWREHLIEDGQRVRLRGWAREVFADGSAVAGNREPMPVGYRHAPRAFTIVGSPSMPVQLIADD